MSTPTCVRCGRPTPDGYADVICGVERPRAWLAEIADMVPAARDVAQRQARHGAGGGASGKPGSSLPIDLGATSRLDAVQGSLSTWVWHAAEERGVNLAEINAGGLTWSARVSGWVDQHGSLVDDLRGSALWLAGHCEWFRHRPEADEWLTDVEACARVVRGIARGPAAQRYLGPCGNAVATIAAYGPHPEQDVICGGDVYGPQGGKAGTCRTCGAQVDQGERLAWRDGQLAERLVDTPIPARDIAYALRLNVKTIRSWATERRTDSGVILRKAMLATYCRLGEHFVPWADLPRNLTPAQREAELRARGPRLHYVAEVRQLAIEAAMQRAENEAKRAHSSAAVDNLTSSHP